VAENITWKQPANPPPPMFLGEKERNLVKQVNDELIERVIGQGIIYYPVSLKHTNYHSLYGEAINKSFLTPIRVNALINWEGSQTSTTGFGIDRRSSITINFHKRRLTEDQDLQVQEGDFVLYGNLFYEIVTLAQPRELFGQVDHKMEIAAKCIRARDGMFEESSMPEVTIEKYKATAAETSYVYLTTPASSSAPVSSHVSGSGAVPIYSGADSGSLDYQILEDFDSNPCEYVGYHFYLTDLPSPPIASFVMANKWYWNENCVWHPSPFMI